jgi:dTDP-4-dehydrorhamnose reductase
VSKRPQRSDPGTTSGRIVVTGSGGQVGRYLVKQARRRGKEVLGLTSAQWDITDPEAAQRIVEPGDVVVNCAAYTAVDAAETEPARAEAVNAVGAGNVARACAAVGARLIHVSTDYVFSGEQQHPYEIDDPTGPLSVYGHTKLAGEREVRTALPEAQVVRTAWVYTGIGNDFVATMRRLAAGDGPVSVVADQVGSPTYVADLVDALLQIAEGGITAPLLHAANDGAVSRFELARAVFEGMGVDAQRVRPVGTDQHPRPAPRPPYSALSGHRSAAAGLMMLRHWRDGLASALQAAQSTT